MHLRLLPCSRSLSSLSPWQTQDYLLPSPQYLPPFVVSPPDLPTFPFLIKVTHFIHSYKYSSWENTNSRRLLYSCAIAHTLIRDVCPYANSPCFSAALFQRLKINLSLLRSNPIHRPFPCICTSINPFIKKLQLLYKRVYRARIAHLYITEFVLQTRVLKQRRYFRRCFRAYLLVL